VGDNTTHITMLALGNPTPPAYVKNNWGNCKLELPSVWGSQIGSPRGKLVANGTQ